MLEARGTEGRTSEYPGQSKWSRTRRRVWQDVQGVAKGIKERPEGGLGDNGDNGDTNVPHSPRARQVEAASKLRVEKVALNNVRTNRYNQTKILGQEVSKARDNPRTIKRDRQS